MKQTRKKHGETFVFDWHDASREKPSVEGTWYWTKRLADNAKTVEVLQQCWRMGCVGQTWWVWSDDGQGYVPTNREAVTAWAEITDENEGYL